MGLSSIVLLKVFSWSHFARIFSSIAGRLGLEPTSGYLDGFVWSLICFPVFDLLDVTPDLALVDGSDSVKIL